MFPAAGGRVAAVSRASGGPSTPSSKPRAANTAVEPFPKSNVTLALGRDAAQLVWAFSRNAVTGVNASRNNGMERRIVFGLSGGAGGFYVTSRSRVIAPAADGPDRAEPTTISDGELSHYRPKPYVIPGLIDQL